jgi:DNA-directed RNA polymerase subunit beta'
MGRLLLNDVLPSSHHISSNTSKKQLNTMMADLARKDPHRYAQTIGDLKRVGDAVATDEGLTIGLDDIEPDYALRDKVLEPALAQIKKTRDSKKRVALIEQMQGRLLDGLKKHPGQGTAMTYSGARGKPGQYLKTVSTPVAAVDDQNEIIPWVISKSYAEGLKSPDAWIAMAEARRNAVESNISVSAPGEVNKLLIGNMSDQLITLPDCGTTNGVAMYADDPHLLDRYLAQSIGGVSAGTIMTAQLAAKLKGKTLVMRSPMTCEAPGGVCQRCYGLNTKGQVPQVGFNVGMIAAHAMGEPLTQMTLSAKHATRTAGSEAQKTALSGLTGFKQLTEIPQSFFNKATLASHAGNVTAVKAAPQGGHYVHVDEQEHYVPPQLGVRVRRGAPVEAGDALSDGIPKPDEVVKHKGLGAGRRYLVDQLHGIYDRQGIDLDKRHLELLAKTDLNYVRIMDQDSEDLGVMRGDVIDYNRFRAAVSKDAKKVAVTDAIGSTLGDNALHHTVGTRVTPTIARELARSGVKRVQIAPRIPVHEPIMKPISRTPLLHPDWLAKLGHRNLKNVILEGAAFGELSDVHGRHPVPAFVFGEEFGAGSKGRY